MSGYCDICQMKDRFKDMILLQCKDCKVKIHDRCYGIDVTKFGKQDAQFSCWACRAVGKSVKVRERDASTGKRIVRNQSERPTQCCLCSVNDGTTQMHAMHAIFDAHGTRGRQIWLPPDEKTGERHLAWAHTLCALMVNGIRGATTTGTLFGCTSRGYYGDPDDMEYLSDSESVNSDLDDQYVVNDTHHYVFWGFLDQCRGRPLDEWGTNLAKAKSEGLKCIYCGANDDKTTILNGQQVFASLRVPLQCTTNNRAEYRMFRKFHHPEEKCCQAMHAGCAAWGRNERGEYSLVRRAYYYPGIQHMKNKRDKEPVVEIYCDCHAQDLFLRDGIDAASLMLDRHPGPFSPATGVVKKRLDKWDGKMVVDEMDQNAQVLNMETTEKHKTSGGKGETASAWAVTLQGKTGRKKRKELERADDAVAIRTEKHGRLATKYNTTDTSAHAKSQTEPSDLAQRIFESMAEEKRKTLSAGKPFDSTISAPIRIRWLNISGREGIEKEEFDVAWKKASEAVDKGVVLDGERKGIHERERAADGNLSVDSQSQRSPLEVPGASSSPAKRQKRDSLSTAGSGLKGGSSNVQTKENWSTLVRSMRNELDGQVERLILEPDNENATKSAEEIILRVKSTWKKKLGWSKPDWKKFWREVKSDLSCLEIESGSVSKTRTSSKEADGPSSKSQESGSMVHTHTASKLSEEPVPKSRVSQDTGGTKSVEPSTSEKNRPIFGNATLQELHANFDLVDLLTDPEVAEEDKHDDNVRTDTTPPDDGTSNSTSHSAALRAIQNSCDLLQERASPPPHRWSHLAYGPHYDRTGFKFGDWDEYEEI